MSAEVSEADRDRFASQQAQDPAAAGEVADLRHKGVVHAVMHELLKFPVGTDHAECRGAGAEKIPRGADDLPQHHRQPQVAGYQGIGTQQPAQPPLCGQQVTGPLHQLHEQLIQLQPWHVRKAKAAGRVRGTRSARHHGVLTCRAGLCRTPRGRR